MEQDTFLTLILLFAKALNYVAVSFRERVRLWCMQLTFTIDNKKILPPSFVSLANYLQSVFLT